MALFYNPTSIQAASLLQRRPMSEAQKQEALSKALQEQMANDPRSGQIQDWRDRSMTPFGVGAGLTGVAAQMASALVAKGQEKKLAGDYQDRQAKQNEAYSRILAGDPLVEGSLPPQQRDMIAKVLQTGDPNMIEAVVGQVVKQSFDPTETPSYQTYTGSDGQQYAWNPKKPDEQPRALPNSQKPEEFDNIETVVDGRPGIYRQSKRTGKIGDFVGALPPKQPSTVVNNIDNGEKSFNKKFGENQAANFEAMITQAQQAPQTISKINEFRNITASGVPTGKVQDMTLPARQFFNSIGITDDKNIAGQEAINSIAANFVLDKFQSLKGPQTDKDAVLVASAVPQLSKTPEGNTIMLDLAERAEQYKIEMANEASKYVSQNGQLDANWISYYNQWAAQNPLLTPELRGRVQAAKSGKPAAAQTGRPKIRNITVE